MKLEIRTSRFDTLYASVVSLASELLLGERDVLMPDPEDRVEEEREVGAVVVVPGIVSVANTWE